MGSVSWLLHFFLTLQEVPGFYMLKFIYKKVIESSLLQYFYLPFQAISVFSVFSDHFQVSKIQSQHCYVNYDNYDIVMLIMIWYLYS